jgi:hypothetical protein
MKERRNKPITSDCLYVVILLGKILPLEEDSFASQL